MGSHWVRGGRHPRRCRERFRRRSGQQPPRPYRTTGKSCSWPLLVLLKADLVSGTNARGEVSFDRNPKRFFSGLFPNFQRGPLCHDERTSSAQAPTSGVRQFQPRVTLPPTRAVVYERISIGGVDDGGGSLIQKSQSDT